MKVCEMRQRLEELDSKATILRQKLRFSPPNKLLYRARPSMAVGWVAVVEADGIGGAWTSIVEGNFPLDYLALYERHFSSEAEATCVAEAVVQLRANPEVVLQPEVIKPLSRGRCEGRRVRTSKRGQHAA
jgi:hypothetical protein